MMMRAHNVVVWNSYTCVELYGSLKLLLLLCVVVFFFYNIYFHPNNPILYLNHVSG